MDGRYRGRAVPRPAGAAHGRRRRTRAIEDGATIEGPCFIDEGVARQGGRAHRPVLGDRPADAGRGGRRRSTAPSSGRTAASAARPPSATPSSAATATSAATSRVDGGAVLGDKTTLTDYTRDLTHEHQSQTSSRPTTSAASTRPRSTRTCARQIGRGFVAYLEARRDRRVARHARLVAGARRRVHRRRARAGRRRRRLRHARHRHDVLRRRRATTSTAARRSPRRTTPKQYNGIKMVRAEALPLSGDAGIGDIRDMIANDRAAAARGHAAAR